MEVVRERFGNWALCQSPGVLRKLVERLERRGGQLRFSGTVERAAAAAMIVRHSPGAQRITIGGDKGFDTANFVADMRTFNVTPHIAQNTTGRRSAIDGRTTRHPGYAISQQKRKRVEEPFGWGKTLGGLARPMLRGVKKLDFKFIWTMAAYDLIKLPKLIGAAA